MVIRIFVGEITTIVELCVRDEHLHHVFIGNTCIGKKLFDPFFVLNGVTSQIFGNTEPLGTAFEGRRILSGTLDFQFCLENEGYTLNVEKIPLSRLYRLPNQ